MWLGWYAGSVFQVGLASGCLLTVFLCSVHGMTWAYTANAAPLGGNLYMQMLVYLSVCILIALYSHFPLGVWVSIIYTQC